MIDTAIETPGDRFDAASTAAPATDSTWIPLEPSPPIPLALEVDGETAILRHFNCELPGGRIGF